MAESLPPESDNKKQGADDEELVQIGAHSIVFPSPEQESTSSGVMPVAVAATQVSEQQAMDASQTTKTSATSPAAVDTDAAQSATPAETSKREPCLMGCLHDILLVLISALLGGALVLGVLLLLNGTLDMRSHDAVVALKSYQESLSDQLTSLTGQVNAHENSLNALDQGLSDTSGQLDAVDAQVQALDSQVQDLDGQVQTIDGDVQALGEQVVELNRQTQTMDIRITTVREEVIVLNQEVAKLSVRTDKNEADIADINQQLDGVNQAAERFDTFTEGLRVLAESLAKPSTASPAPGISTNEPISSTEPVTVSITITTTETITSAEPITPTVSLPLVSNGADADTAETDDRTAPAIANNPILAMFPPMVPLPDLASGKSHIFGLVWDDLNGDGQPQEDEGPIPAVTIVLRDARGNVLVSTVTDAAGRYIFANIEPGVYIIEEKDPEDVVSTSSNLVTVPALINDASEVNFADQY